MRRSVRQTVVAVLVALSTMACLARVAVAQTGSVEGRVSDSAGTPLAASVNVIVPGNVGAYASQDGHYQIGNVPGGTHRVVTHYLGFHTDTSEVTIIPGRTVKHNVVLRQSKRTLETVVTRSARLDETIAGALQQQKNADNIITVMSGDEIRALPNANAAEALARLPGVTAERDEGEGKYVEIRGTPPWFQHVTINGADVPGTLGTDVRAVKLDDVPADILGSITVSKTLLADMDADAIGGSVNLESKIPEGAPHGYVQGIYGYQTLQGTSNGQGTFTYGGRIGPDRKIGFLLGGEYDRTNRTISDVEPSYGVDFADGAGNYIPVPNGAGYNHWYPAEWSQRVYDYYRTRYGLDWDADYRFSGNSSIALRGLWSAFFDEATRWETDVSGGTDALVGGVPTATGGNVTNTDANRGPIEHTWGSTLQGTHPIGNVKIDWQANWAGSTATTHDHLEDDYTGPSGFNYTYNTSKLTPQYFIPNGTGAGQLPGGNAALADGSSYLLNGISTDNELTNGQIFGGKVDVTVPFTIGDLPAVFKFGGKYRNDHKGYFSDQPSYGVNSGVNLPATMFPSTYTYSDFYGHICEGCYTNAPFTNQPTVENYLHNNPANFTFQDNSLSDAEATYAGTEQVTAAYVMQTLDVSKLHINAGVRVEHTDIGYVGNVAPPDAVYGYQTTTTHGYSSYTQVFPSLQLRYALDDNTNFRAVFSRGIARPNYQDLAPFFTSVNAIPDNRNQGLSEGNPNLQPEKAWNYDLLAEHYFQSVGVISGGAFYKQISDFYFERTFTYNGGNSQFNGNDNGGNYYFVTQNQNGPSAQLWGVEADWQQHLSFLPGALAGIGFDLNWTHVESRATIPQDTTIGYPINIAGTDSAFPYKGQPFRHSPLPRQFPNMFNVTLLYDYHPVNFRVSGQYTSASVYQYGTDGTSNPQSGDTWNYPHWQIDGELQVEVIRGTTLQVQGLNMNNAVFGFFTGLPGNGHEFNNQREYYGATWTFGLRQNF
jgi:TonB-dependent receptor